MFVLLSILLIAADQAVKYWAVHVLQPAARIPVWDGVFSLAYVENRGAAFGIFQDGRWPLVAFTVLVLLALTVYLIKTRPRHRLMRLSAALVYAGAVGNLIDRVWHGSVVDLFSFDLIQFPVFNVADICVVCGVILLAVYVLFVSPAADKT